MANAKAAAQHRDQVTAGCLRYTPLNLTNYDANNAVRSFTNYFFSRARAQAYGCSSRNERRVGKSWRKGMSTFTPAVGTRIWAMPRDESGAGTVASVIAKWDKAPYDEVIVAGSTANGPVAQLDRASAF